MRKRGQRCADQPYMDCPDTPEHTRPPQSQEPLRSVYSNDPEMRELVDFFVEDLTRRVQAMRAALDCMDVARLRALAHQLSGTASGYGFPPIGDAARNLEAQLPKQRRHSPNFDANFRVNPDVQSDPQLEKDDGLLDEMMISQLREHAEDLIATCKRAIPVPEPLPFEQTAEPPAHDSNDGRTS